MFTLQPLVRKFIAIRYLAAPCVLLASLATPAVVSAQFDPVQSDPAQRVPVSAPLLSNASSLVDAGPVPTSQPATVTLRLAPTAARAAALDQLLADQSNPASPSYHHWLTPQQFAAGYGATDDQVAALTTWAQSQGLTVSAISTGKTRLTLLGSTDQVQRAFAVSLHAYVVGGSPRIAATSQPSVPLSISPMVSGVSGLDNLPSAISASVTAISPITGATLLSASGADPLAAATAAIDANAAPVLSLNQTACGTPLTFTDLDAYRAAFRQANAQGITILANSACPTDDSSTQPSPLLSLPEVTAVTLAPASPDAAVTTDARPSWQVAPGLPADTLRHQPDLETTSVAALAQTLTSVARQTGTPQGNINAALYSLATTPDLYTQPDAAPAGTWEPATGLGLVDLTVLARVLPRVSGSFTTTTSLSANNYAITYGQQLILTAKVLAPVYTTAQPTGTVTYSAGGQSLGSATIDTSGNSVYTLPTSLSVGTYNIIATYSGDTNYSTSSSAPPIIVTVSIVNATITATVSPSSSAPYGSTATVTATVSLPGTTGAPSGLVNAVVEGINGSSASAILTPNPGGNTATANILIATPPPGTYTIEVSCAGNTNFQCQSPVDIKNFTTVKGNTIINITTNPAAPQAGQPVTITANVSSAGNGPGPYNFTGTMTFYDNGKLIGTAAVASNQASASVSLPGNATQNIVASYGGDTNWNASVSAPQAVNPTLLPSTVTLTPNVTTALAGANIVITATVFTTAANTVGPTGTVSFYDTYNSAIIQLGAITLTPNGPNQSIARYTTTGLLAGVHSIYAVYNGDANFAAATSSTLGLNITDYNVIMNPPTLTLKAGQTGQVVMLVGAIGGFNGTISFGCTPPSGAEATCSFSNASLQGGGGATTMTIRTTLAQAKPTQQSTVALPPSAPWPLVAGSILALLSCFILPRRRRAVPLLLTALLAVCLLPSLGCGLGATAASTPGTTPSDPGTPLGTQIFTITTAGSDGINTTRHNFQYQVTIQ